MHLQLNSTQNRSLEQGVLHLLQPAQTYPAAYLRTAAISIFPHRQVAKNASCEECSQPLKDRFDVLQNRRGLVARQILFEEEMIMSQRMPAQPGGPMHSSVGIMVALITALAWST